MTVTFDRICADWLALRGESPDLLPVLEEGEESAVLTLSRRLRVQLFPAAVAATLATDPDCLDETRSATLRSAGHGDCHTDFALPDDFLRLVAFEAPDLPEAVRETEPEGTLRRHLGAQAPPWMTGRHRPMAVVTRHPGGRTLRVYGCAAVSATVTYTPVPEFDGTSLTISTAAYHRMLRDLAET